MAPFRFDYTSHPSETIRDAMLEQGLTIREFSSASGLPMSTVLWLMDPLCDRITYVQAVAITRGVGGSPDFWMRRWQSYEAEWRRLNPPRWYEVGSRRTWNGRMTLRRRFVEAVWRAVRGLWS